jgi:hypothetical protein
MRAAIGTAMALVLGLPGVTLAQVSGSLPLTGCDRATVRVTVRAGDAAQTGSGFMFAIDAPVPSQASKVFVVTASHLLQEPSVPAPTTCSVAIPNPPGQAGLTQIKDCTVVEPHLAAKVNDTSLGLEDLMILAVQINNDVLRPLFGEVTHRRWAPSGYRTKFAIHGWIGDGCTGLANEAAYQQPVRGLLQLQGSAFPGYSGGSVLDEADRIVGTYVGGTGTQGYVVPREKLQALMRKAGADLSSLTDLLQEADAPHIVDVAPPSRSRARWGVSGGVAVIGVIGALFGGVRIYDAWHGNGKLEAANACGANHACPNESWRQTYNDARKDQTVGWTSAGIGVGLIAAAVLVYALWPQARVPQSPEGTIGLAPSLRFIPGDEHRPPGLRGLAMMPGQ